VIRLARRHARWLIAATAFALVCGLRIAGALAPLENWAADTRARLLTHEVHSDTVIVGIDAQSLAALETWPWPRTYHARLLQRLFAADPAPSRVFMDIDFSSSQGGLDDAALELALMKAPVPVLLPTFYSYATGSGEGLLATRPLPSFARHAQQVSVIRQTDADGFTRSWRDAWQIDHALVPSIIDREGSLPEGRDITIDYSISPASFHYVSYVDLLDGRVDPEVFAGKSVFIGSVAAELGDMLAVPVYGSLPGVVVQALAAETVAQGVPMVPPAWLSMALLAVWAGLAALCLRSTWRQNLLVMMALCAVIACTGWAGFARWHLWLDVAAPMLLVGLAYIAVTLRSLDRQTWRALTYALGMRRRDALLRSIVQSSTDCIVCIDERGRIRTANHAATRFFGCPRNELIDEPIGRFIDLFSGDMNGAALADLHGEVCECNAHTLVGAVFPVEVSVSRVRLQSERLFTAFVRDIRERRAQQHRLQHQATHDSLTGLPNRAALQTHLDAALGRAGQPEIVLLMLDLCQFKEVNDALGHQVGDGVLCEVAQRFGRTLGGNGFIARIGGDEFTVVLDAPADGAVTNRIAQSLAEVLRAPIQIDGVAMEVGVSIGIARAPEDGRDAHTLLRHADVAMYAAKRRGTAFEYYDAAADKNTVRRLEIGGELRAAIARNALVLHYQPQVNLRTGRVETCEALLRWFHPVHGAISPAEFIAIAESSELIRPLTEWTIEAALAQVSAWRERGLHVRVAVNLSARVLQDTAFPERLQQLIAQSTVPPHSLELEITESAMMIDPVRALDVLQAIHRLGVPIAIDDFGTGYSSLGYLRDLPVHSLKLDKSFVKGSRSSADDRIIVESTAQMARALRLQLVAEGVETEWDVHFLADAGYDMAQGFRYSGALPADRFLTWVVEFNATAMIGTGETARIRRAVLPGPEAAELAQVS